MNFGNTKLRESLRVFFAELQIALRTIEDYRMNRIAISLAIVAFFAIPSIQAQRKKPSRATTRNPCSKAMSQLELNQCFCDQSTRADAELNHVYQQVLAANAEDKLLSEKLKSAQRAWFAFRDAQLEALYPTVENPRVTYGSIYPMCHCIAEAELTTERTRQLKRMLDEKDGDACN